MPKGLWSAKQLHYCPVCQRDDVPYEHEHSPEELAFHEERLRRLGRLRESQERVLAAHSGAFRKLAQR